MDLVAPWNDSVLRVEAGHRVQLKQLLKSRGYPIDEILQSPPNEYSCQIIEQVIQALMDKDWVVAAFENLESMRIVQRILPIIYAYSLSVYEHHDNTMATYRERLSKPNSVLNITGSSLEAACKKAYLDDGEELDTIKSAGLLLYESIDSGSRRLATEYSGHVMDLVQSRFQPGYRFLMTTTVDPHTTLKALQQDIATWSSHLPRSLVRGILQRSAFVYIQTHEQSSNQWYGRDE